MVKLLKRYFALFSKRQNSILSAATVMVIAVALSRILGLIRDWLLVSRFDAIQLAPYIAAFRIPNLIFELLVMGALSTAFIPVFTTYLDTKGEREAFRMASSIINIGFLFFFIFSIPFFLFASEMTNLLAPGFSGSAKEMMASFTKIMIVAQVLPLIIGNFATGILQSYRNFLIPALAPVLYNIGIIIGIVFLSPMFGLYGPVFGVVIGAVLFTVIQIPVVFSFGYKHSFNIDYKNPGVREVGKLMLPRTIGLAISQIDTTIDLVLSTLISPAAVTVFSFAQHLQQVPIGLFGASIAQASLPSLSSSYAKKDTGDFKRILISSFHQILFFIIPFSAILIVLRLPVVRLIFGVRSKLDIITTLEISKTLAFFCISLFAQSTTQLIARGFYAMHDSKTPVIAGAFSVVVNTVLSIFFVSYLKYDVWVLGFSTSIASIIQLVILMWLINSKMKIFDNYEFIMPIFKMFLSGVVTGFALYIPIKLFDKLVFDTEKTIDLIMLTSLSGFVGLSVYLFLSWFLGIPQFSVVYRLFSKAKSLKKGLIIDTSTEVINAQETKI